MRNTASVLRGFIRETLLRETQTTTPPPTPSHRPGKLPGASGKAVKNTSVLKQLQAIIGADESDRYDDETENAWDDFVDMLVKQADLVGATPVEVKTNWASAAKKMKLSVDRGSLKFTPDIQGMLSFAEVFEHDSKVEEPTGPWRADAQPDVWPIGVTLDDANEWDVALQDTYLFVTNVSPVEMYDAYDTIAKALQNSEKVKLIGAEGSLGYNDDDEIKDAFPITIKDTDTLDKIFKGTAAEREAKSESEKRFSSEKDEA